MPETYTYRQYQDRILKRMGRSINDMNARDNVKASINEVYTEIITKKEIWQKLRTSEPLTYPPNTIDAFTIKLFRHIDNMFTIDNGIIRPMHKSTPSEFNAFIRDMSGAPSTYPRKYLIMGADLDQASGTFMHHNIRIYPPSQSELIVNIDGFMWPPDLDLNEDKPYLGPDLGLALIYGTVAYLLELDEDERADKYREHYLQLLDLSAAMENSDLSNYEPVTGALSSYGDEEDTGPAVKYPWE
jgi:hypothetical protein